MADKKNGSAAARKKAVASKAQPPWMKIPEPATRKLRVYALDPSAGNFVGNVMSMSIRWERNLKPGPVGRRFAVIDYDGANRCYYPPVDLNDYRILARNGLDPSESDPRFHQQMVYAVASQTVEKFEAALGRTIHWRRADRPAGQEKPTDPADDIWVLKLYPHAMVQANAFYSREAQGILFGYFRAAEKNQGNNLPGQRVFTCLSHDIIAHEVTHAVIDGIRTFFTEPTNPDVLAFHEAFADLTALFLHFSHKDALLDTIRKTGGRLYSFELTPDAAPVEGSASLGGASTGTGARLRAEAPVRNPLVELAQQFGQASGMGHGLRAALEERPDPGAMGKRVNDPHYRGSILVAAVFDAYFSTYLQASADLFRIYRAGGASMASPELPTSLATLLTETASKTADEFFQLCARALDYCPPIDVTFGDFLRALITASVDLRPEDDRGVRQALMQAFRVRGIYPDSASFFSEGALCWTRVPDWTRSPDPEALPPVAAEVEDPDSGERAQHELQFGLPGGLTREQKNLNGAILRAYAKQNAARLGFDDDPGLAPERLPYAPSFHQVFRMAPDGRTRIDMVVELVQTRRVPFDKDYPEGGSFPLRGGVTLIIAAPDRDHYGHHIPPKVRFAVRKPLTGAEGEMREARQRRYALATGLANGDTGKDSHFQVDFGLLHQGV
ncbi:hypothetical protein [Variovorax saccharolyticus]|uniref:hypothetical protein n=1 Tax=Variovorax saccharolyticus TaxID=3053516 RepID=UPI002576FF52|nr:hypothetical protein [Variovorax sp. J31P216]MDM0026303.1 hypothetical protein [Variovorax sp. J31P216]